MDNLPDGTYDGDPRAPWNKPDPWEGHVCEECRYYGGVFEDGFFDTVNHCCAWSPMSGEGSDVRLVYPKDHACEQWEAL